MPPPPSAIFLESSTEPIPATFTSINLSISGGNAIGIDITGRMCYSSNYGVSWVVSTVPTGVTFGTLITLSISGLYAIAVAINGKMYYSHTGGQIWLESSSHPPYPVGGLSDVPGSMDISGTNGVYAKDNVQWYTTDGGDTWQTIIPPTGITFDDTSFAISGSNFIVTDVANSYIYYSTTGGATWALSINTGPSQRSFNNLVISGSNAVSTFLDTGNFFYSTNGGLNWTFSLGAASGIPFQDGTTRLIGSYAIALSQSGDLWYSNDGGRNWNKSTSRPLQTVSLSSSGNCVGIDTNSVLVYAATSASAGWTNSTTQISIAEPLYISGTNALGIGTDGDIYYSSDKGNNYFKATSVPLTTTSQYNSMSISGLNAVAINYYSQTFYSSNGGNYWQLSTLPADDDRLANATISGLNAVGRSSTSKLLYSSNGGQLWGKSRFPASLAINLYAISESNAIAIDGNTNVSYYSTNGGSEWRVSTPDTISFSSQIASLSTIYAIAMDTSGRMLYSSDSGKIWTISSSGTNFANAVISTSPNEPSGEPATGFAVNSSGNMYYFSYSAGNSNWYSVSSPPSTVQFKSALAIYDYTALAVSTTNQMYRSTSGQQLIIATTHPTGVLFKEQFAIYGTNAVSIDSSGNLYYSSNAGGDWYLSLDPTGPDFSNQLSISSANTISVDSTGKIYYSSDGGYTWALATIPTGITFSQNKSFVISGANAVAHDTNGYMYYSSNTGNTWNAITSPSGTVFQKTVLSSTTSNGIALDSTGNIRYTTDGGNNWNVPTTVPASTTFSTKFAISGLNAVAIDVSGNMYYSTDGGNTWNMPSSYTPSFITFTDVVISGNYAIALSTAATQQLWVSSDSGQTWRICIQPTQSFTTIKLSTSGFLVFGLAINSTGVIYYSTSGGPPFNLTWSATSTPAPFNNVCNDVVSVASFYYQYAVAISNSGDLYYFNYPSNWLLSTVPRHSPFTNASISGTNAIAVDSSSNIYYSSDAGTTWALGTVSPRSTTFDNPISMFGLNVITTDISGKMYYSSDGGYSWALSTSSSIVFSDYFAVSSTNASGQSTTGSMYYSTDGGNNWSISAITPSTTFSNPIKMSNPYVISTNTAGIMYSSSNAGQNWNQSVLLQDITTLDPAISGANAIVCTTDDLVYYSSDGGINWYPSASYSGVFTDFKISGLNVITTNVSGNIYYSADGGVTLQSSTTTPPATVTKTGVLNLSLSNAITTDIIGNIYYSTDGGNHWSRSNASFSANAQENVTSISDTNAVAVAHSYIDPSGNSFGIMNYSIDGGINWSVSTVPSGALFRDDQPLNSPHISGSNAIAIAIVGEDTRLVYSVDGGANWLFATQPNVDISSSDLSGTHALAIEQYAGYARNILYATIYSPCFNKDTKILCLKNNVEEYIPIQNLKKGDLVKTLCHGFVPIHMIGQTNMRNYSDDNFDERLLYVCARERYPELFEDLIITGHHSILIYDFKAGEEEKTVEILGDIYVTDGMYRLPVCADKRSIPYKKDGIFTVYHLALDNENYYMNYGIYANGLLVESCSKRYLKELSNMKLIE